MVRYFTEDVDFKFRHRALNNAWYRLVASSEVRRLGDVCVIFCSDRYILDVNVKYLGHDYFTDIITFDYCEGGVLSGDLFVSIDTVRENALHYGTEFDDELNRVLVHGLLHLVGYDDLTPGQRKTMREKEDYYLEIRKSLQL